MFNKKYIPHPVNTVDIFLPTEIDGYIETIARNVHEVWAAERIAEGWTVGKERDDTKKTHPCLIPYEELPEFEKDYDRNTCRETIKMLLKLGFTLSH